MTLMSFLYNESGEVYGQMSGKKQIGLIFLHLELCLDEMYKEYWRKHLKSSY